MAAAKVGLVLATINPTYRASELEYVLRQGDIAALFFQAKVRDHDCVATVSERVTPADSLGAIRSESLPKLRYAFLIGPPASADAPWQPTPFRDLIALGASVSDDALQPARQRCSPATRPVAIYLRHHWLPQRGAADASQHPQQRRMVAHRLGTTPETRFCTAMPMFHTGGCVLGVLSAL